MTKDKFEDVTPLSDIVLQYIRKDGGISSAWYVGHHFREEGDFEVDCKWCGVAQAIIDIMVDDGILECTEMGSYIERRKR